MSRLRITFHFSLLTSFLFLLSCTPQPQQPTKTFFYLYRFTPSAFIEFSETFQQLREIPFSVPNHCTVLDVYPAPAGNYLLIELNCPSGQTVLFLDTDAGSVTQPITDTDSHFLAWSPDGKDAYLKIDSMGNTHYGLVSANGTTQYVPIAAYTYDVATNPTNHNFTFTFSRGMGQGSELWLAMQGGKVVQQLYADKLNYISFARYSPDGKQIAFIKIPDSQTPFTVGELWAMNGDGSNPRKLADADAGHGYAANWSPDGKRIAFVERENPQDESANQSADSLISNIYVINLESGTLNQVTHFTSGRAETPHWSPDGNTLAFSAVINGRMDVQTADISSGQIRSLITASTCCPAWIRK